MSDPEGIQPEPPPISVESDSDDAAFSGPNLVLLYSLIALALAAAIGFALMIVMPFYHRR
jgi:hypothetical protein